MDTPFYLGRIVSMLDMMILRRKTHPTARESGKLMFLTLCQTRVVRLTVIACAVVSGVALVVLGLLRHSGYLPTWTYGRILIASGVPFLGLAVSVAVVPFSVVATKQAMKFAYSCGYYDSESDRRDIRRLKVLGRHLFVCVFGVTFVGFLSSITLASCLSGQLWLLDSWYEFAAWFGGTIVSYRLAIYVSVRTVPRRHRTIVECLTNSSTRR